LEAKMTAVQTQSVKPTLDLGRLYRVFNALPVEPEGFNKAGDPLDAKGKVMPQRESQKFFLQDGEVFDEAGALVEKLPKHIREKVAAMVAAHPFPGITHPGRLLICPVPGCEFRTTVEGFNREHKRQHQDVTPEQWAELEGKAGRKPQAFGLGDFAEPDTMLEHFTAGPGQRPPTRESAQGEG